MDYNQRILNLENKQNILSQEVKDIKNNIENQNKNLTNLNNKIDSIIDILKQNNNNNNENQSERKKDNDNIPNKYADANGNLANLKNPFYFETQKLLKRNNKSKVNEQIEKENEEDSNISLKEHKREKYSKRDPLYYYYIIKNNEYKCTCRNKNNTFKLSFYCSDTHCPAKDIYIKQTEEFIIGEEAHIPYEDHSYVIPKLIEEKFKKNEFKDIDFKDKNNEIKIKFIGAYFKFLFINDYKLSPTQAKIKFNESFPNLKIDTKEISVYIDTKYREANNLNKEKKHNYNSIIELYDNNGEKISNIIKFKYIII